MALFFVLSQGYYLAAAILALLALKGGSINILIKYQTNYKKGTSYPLIGQFCEVMCQCQKPCFDFYFFQSPQHKSPEAMVVFDISKYRFRLYWSLASVLLPSLAV